MSIYCRADLSNEQVAFSYLAAVKMNAADLFLYRTDYFNRLDAR